LKKEVAAMTEEELDKQNEILFLRAALAAQERLTRNWCWLFFCLVPAALGAMVSALLMAIGKG
jgi:uncharacterized membrane protein